MVPLALALLCAMAISLAAKPLEADSALGSDTLYGELLWVRVAEEFGVPTALGVALLCLLARVLRRLTDAHVQLTTTLATNDSQHVSAVETANLGHALTHEKLDKLNADVQALRDRNHREHGNSG